MSTRRIVGRMAYPVIVGEPLVRQKSTRLACRTAAEHLVLPCKIMCAEIKDAMATGKSHRVYQEPPHAWDNPCPYRGMTRLQATVVRVFPCDMNCRSGGL